MELGNRRLGGFLSFVSLMSELKGGNCGQSRIWNLRGKGHLVVGVIFFGSYFRHFVVVISAFLIDPLIYAAEWETTAESILYCTV